MMLLFIDKFKHIKSATAHKYNRINDIWRMENVQKTFITDDK